MTAEELKVKIDNKNKNISITIFDELFLFNTWDKYFIYPRYVLVMNMKRLRYQLQINYIKFSYTLFKRGLFFWE